MNSFEIVDGLYFSKNTLSKTVKSLCNSLHEENELYGKIYTCFKVITTNTFYNENKQASKGDILVINESKEASKLILLYPQLLTNSSVMHNIVKVSNINEEFIKHYRHFKSYNSSQNIIYDFYTDGAYCLKDAVYYKILRLHRSYETDIEGEGNMIEEFHKQTRGLQNE